MDELLSTAAIHAKIANEFTFTGEEQEMLDGHSEIATAPPTKGLIIERVTALLNGEPTALVRGVKVWALHLVFNDDKEDEMDEFQLRVYESPCYIPPLGKAVPCVCLYSLMVPEDLRRQGLASMVFNQLEAKADVHTKCVMVGPITSDEMAFLLNKRGTYLTRLFFEAYRLPGALH